MKKDNSRMTSYSQSGQDWFVDDLLDHKTHGVFMEIGAHNGLLFSNTFFFERTRDWKGICFEPNPRLYQQLEKNRNCICIEAAASDKEGEFEFLDVCGAEALGGLVDKYDKRRLEKIDRESDRFRIREKKVIKVKCVDVNRVLEEHGITDIDYCSIDTEGGEFDILKSFDFSRVRIKVLTVEQHYSVKGRLRKWWLDHKGLTVEGYLKKKGFRLVGQLGNDLVFQS